MNFQQLLSKLPVIRKYLKIDKDFVEIELIPNGNNFTLKINKQEKYNFATSRIFQLEEKEDCTLPTETLEQFQLKKIQAGDRLQRMEQGDQIAFEEEFIALINMKIRAKFRHAGDEIYCRVNTVIPLAEKFSKEFAQKFRALT